jgi:hypothetical protein
MWVACTLPASSCKARRRQLSCDLLETVYLLLRCWEVGWKKTMSYQTSTGLVLDLKWMLFYKHETMLMTFLQSKLER